MQTQLPNSAPALEEGLRLRSRRVRSDQSQRSTLKLALVGIGIAALVGFVGATVRDGQLPWLGDNLSAAEPTPWAVTAPRRPTQDEQRYVQAVRAIHTQLEQTLTTVGSTAGGAATVEVDRLDARERLDRGLAGARLAELQLRDLAPPASFRAAHERYLTALRQLQESALALLPIYDSAEQAQPSTPWPLDSEASSTLRELSRAFEPESDLPAH